MTAQRCRHWWQPSLLRIHREDIVGGTAATLPSQGFLEAAWVFSGWGGTSRRQSDKDMAQQPEGGGQAARGLQHGAEGQRQHATCSTQAGQGPMALGWDEMGLLGPWAGVGGGPRGDPSLRRLLCPQGPGFYCLSKVWGPEPQSRQKRSPNMQKKSCPLF